MAWEQLDYVVFNQAAQFKNQSPTGNVWVGIAQLPAVPAGQLWRVERISLTAGFTLSDETTGGGPPGLQPVPVYLFDQQPANYTNPNLVPADYTVIASDAWTGLQPVDVADNAAPITVLQGNTFTAVFLWPLGTAFAPGSALIGMRAQVATFTSVAGKATPVAGATPAPAVPMSL